ncbi:hypothetical protein D6D01_04967 [Aureobasidium pullulans]|uniref:Uncharacterized protein n=1 Tax=Aureobasidium pullulans TaxID=5580 RepID=A0A4S9LAR6_AURPU|nr:hypothetical protein D6D01_04967 [Aureobasidium pullulans]
MSDQQNNQDISIFKNKASKQPPQDAAHTDNRLLSLGTNLNHNIDKSYKQSFDDMINMFGKGQALGDENVAHMLLARGDLPVLRKILACGPVDRLFHARKAVEVAEQVIKMYGDDEGVGTELLAVANHALADATTNATNTMNDTDAEKEEDG